MKFMLGRTERWEVSADECAQIEPACAQNSGGMYNETDFTGDIPNLCGTFKSSKAV